MRNHTGDTQMIATSNGLVIRIGRDFVESATGAPVWNVLTNGQTFTVNFECCMDEAQKHVCAVYKSEVRKIPSSFQLQRAI
jgi:hypothetical protein